MINPQLLHPAYVRYKHPSTKRKHYRAAFVAGPDQIIEWRRQRFDTAREAHGHAARILVRWMRLYAAAEQSRVTVEVPGPGQWQRFLRWVRKILRLEPQP